MFKPGKARQATALFHVHNREDKGTISCLFIHRNTTAAACEMKILCRAALGEPQSLNFFGESMLQGLLAHLGPSSIQTPAYPVGTDHAT
ncbi:hypothetical protein CC1G_14558 [Coprinopsis cinerea okayama7|uniref:Uncharacterized protein n=1 Tax=Coprinopsis cinerea (strain Okayama-7 / 130 / ATCC MYA-4618 / FGSC 9003) TaxID=240176 RepID=D6RMN0_COPC7|nr:hypothetical protein CC1G_14558 [Coprinopsis cinerea okayama7\|eukprot:XP_002911126.1 hypothetical protein CC1G_14558 [Coprinopsis cinerea okayama7\